ncbi:MAG TPA: RluA family pseudouridine synthase [Blastocatellia bacterium]|nr:RluA family pseudouridine synthase [Blastocatellia bacterium]
MSAEIQLITVRDSDSGARLDAFLASRLPSISRTKIQRFIDEGDVLVENRVAKPSLRLKAGNQIEIDIPEPEPVSLIPEPIALDIVYEDADLIVVNKPAGLVVHPGAGNQTGTLANGLVFHFNELSETAGHIRPGIVHRIDKETSGLLVIAKNDAAHENLSNQFRDRQVFKLYVALVYGRISDSHGEIDASIGRSSRNRTKMAVLRGGAGRTALTVFEVESRFNDFTLINVQIKTGRTHQIRVHMAHIGHPVVGDQTYGAGRERFVRDPSVRTRIQSLGRHFLHAAELHFAHPKSGSALRFTAPLPPELIDFLARCN